MLKLIDLARDHEEKWKQLSRQHLFLDALRLGISLPKMLKDTPTLLPQAVETERLLREFSGKMLDDPVISGKIWPWQVSRLGYRKLAINIGDLANMLRTKIEEVDRAKRAA